MSYKDRYGGTDIIRTKCNNLQIGWDYESDPENIKERFAVMLYTPWMGDTTNHYHIPFNLKQAKTLHKWLGEFIKEKEKS